MASTKKPESVMITIRNRKTNESKSITVYDATLQEVYDKVKKLFSK